MMINIDLKYIIIGLAVFIALIAANVYQFQNPRILEIPADPVQIDSTGWVQKSAYASQKEIIRKLQAENSALAQRVQEAGDAIVSYANLTGRLRLQVDSLQSEKTPWYNIPEAVSLERDSLTPDEKSFLEKAREDLRELQSLIDTTFITQKAYGGGLFVVTGYMHFRGNQFHQDVELEQLRDIELSVINTVNKDQTRILTYVTSPDFGQLEYKSLTALKRKKKLPWFWIGVATGVVGTAIILE